MALHIHRSTVIANHLILNGYGTWHSNDPRGSGSIEVRKPELRPLGPVHFGRKSIQPSRQDLKAFHSNAKDLLDFEVGWFDQLARNIIAAVAAQFIAQYGYTCYAFRICSNHVHMMMRVHRDSGREIWQRFANSTRVALQESKLFSFDHPVWANRPYVVFKNDVPAVERGIIYIDDNPGKEGLPRQHYEFVRPYDG